VTDHSKPLAAGLNMGGQDVPSPDLAAQGKLLAEVAHLLHAHCIRSTANTPVGSINAPNLREADVR
jgi:hypothetical protein